MAVYTYCQSLRERNDRAVRSQRAADAEAKGSTMKRVCVDDPVFDAYTVFWNQPALCS
jgi:NAD(P)H-flavin reductase